MNIFDVDEGITLFTHKNGSCQMYNVTKKDGVIHMDPFYSDDCYDKRDQMKGGYLEDNRHGGMCLCAHGVRFKILGEGNFEGAFETMELIQKTAMLINFEGERSAFSAKAPVKYSLVYGDNVRQEVDKNFQYYVDNPDHLTIMVNDDGDKKVMRLWSQLLNISLYTVTVDDGMCEESAFYSKCKAIEALAKVPEGDIPVIINSRKNCVMAAISIKDGEVDIKPVADKLYSETIYQITRLRKALSISLWETEAGNEIRIHGIKGGVAERAIVTDKSFEEGIRENLLDIAIDHLTDISKDSEEIAKFTWTPEWRETVHRFDSHRRALEENLSKVER